MVLIVNGEICMAHFTHFTNVIDFHELVDAKKTCLSYFAQAARILATICSAEILQTYYCLCTHIYNEKYGEWKIQNAVLLFHDNMYVAYFNAQTKQIIANGISIAA